MKISKILLILTIISFLGTLFIYSSLPEEIPIHWGINGEVDNYASKPFAILIGLLPLGVYLLMLVLPKIDPKRESYSKHKKAYRITSIAIVIVLIITNWMSLLTALGYEVNISIIINLFVGILFIIIGNYMPQIRNNYFFGIRNPWTLSNENVWRKTHRLGGYGFVISGLLFILSIPFKNILSMLPIVFIIIFVIGINVYSYLLFTKEKE